MGSWLRPRPLSLTGKRPLLVPALGVAFFFFLFFELWNASQICVSSLGRGRANLLFFRF